MKPITIKLPRWMIRAIDEIIEREIYPNRSEFIREAIRNLLRRYINIDQLVGLVKLDEKKEEKEAH